MGQFFRSDPYFKLFNLFIMDPFIIGSGISAIGSLANSVIGTSANSNLNRKNRKWQEYMATVQYQRQRDLTHDTPLLQKQGLVDAGMSPSAMGAFAGPAASVSSVPNSPSSLPEYVPFDMDSALQALLLPSKIKESKANADLARTNADMADLKLKEMQDKQNAYQSASTRTFVVDEDTGIKHFSDDSDFKSWYDEYVKTHEVPDLQVLAGHFSQEAINAAKVMSDLSTAIAHNNAEQITSKFNQTLTDLKLKDRSVMSALYHMDSKQFELLSKQIDKLGSDIDVNKSIKDLNSAKSDEARQNIAESIARSALFGAETKMTYAQIKQIKNSNIGALFDGIKDAKGFSDRLIAIGKLILTALVGSNGGAFHASLGLK